jgi:hypothetical protein
MNEEKARAVEVIHKDLTMGGEVILSKDCLVVKGGSEIRNHWYNSPQKTDDFFASVPLERIEKVFTANNRKNEKYREMCEKLKLDYKRRVGIVVVVNKNEEGRMRVLIFAPQTSPDFRKEEANRKFGDAMRMAAGGIPSPIVYDWQLRTALRWVQWINEAIQNRKIAILEQGGLVQAWKCEYCQTLNEAKREGCSHCGSPRRK